MELYYHISDKNTLKEEIIKYKSVLSKSAYRYLESLLSLESSAVASKFNIIGEELLSKIPGYSYKSIVKFNLYHRALNVLERNGIRLVKSNNMLIDKEIRLLGSTKLDNSSRIIDVLGLTIDTRNNSKLLLFNSLNDDNIKEKEVEELQRRIKFLEEKREKIRNRMIPRIDYNYDYSECDNKIKQYEKAIYKINSRKKLTLHDKEEIEKANQFHSLLLEEFGLDEKELKPEGTEYIFGSSHKYMKKVKTKTKGNVRIINNDYYL